jgi:hypothetical protein
VRSQCTGRTDIRGMFLVFIPPYAHSLDHNHHRLCLKFRPFLIRPTPAVLPYSHNKSLEVVHPLHSSLVLSSSSSSYFIRSCCCPVPPLLQRYQSETNGRIVVCGMWRICWSCSTDRMHSLGWLIPFRCSHTHADRNRPTDFQLRKKTKIRVWPRVSLL